MADIDNALRLWSSTASNNKPLGSTSIGSGLDDNLRQIQSVVRQYLASPGTTIASAATVDLSLADGRQIPISGTNTVTGLGTEVSGVEYLLTSVGSVPFKNSSALSLPNSADFVSTAGDYLLAVSKGAGNWVVPWKTPPRNSVSLKEAGAIGDGVTDDSSAIQSAISSGAKYIEGVQGKTYLLGATGLQFATLTDVKFIGNGASLKFNAAATQTVTGGGSSMLLMTGCTNCAIEGWKVNGNAQATNFVGLNGNTDCSVSYNYVSSGGLNALIFGTNNTRSRYNFNVLTTTTGASRGIWVGNFNASQTDTDVEVIGNHITGLPATGIVTCSVGGRVVGNHISGLTSGSGIIFGGSNGFHSQNLSITGNTCKNCNFHGIQLDTAGWASSADTPSGISITGNICTGNVGQVGTSAGIYLASHLTDSTVSGNICADNSQAGIQVAICDRISVTGNACFDTRSAGSRTQAQGINITSNTGLSNTDISVTGNSVYNNTSTGIVVGSDATGLNTGISIIGNTVTSNGGYGIQVTEGGTGNTKRVVVVGNVSRSNVSQDMRIDPLDVLISDNQYSTLVNAAYFSFTNGATTPSVLGGRKVFNAANTGATSITNLTNGVDAQTLTIYATTANTTLVNGSFILKGGVNTTIPSNGMISFYFFNTLWYETSRSY